MTTSLVVGNWKMHGSRADCSNWARSIADGLRERTAASVETAIAPPYTALGTVKEILHASDVRLGAQNCHWQNSGAFTGEISPSMLKEIGCDYVILGHSERRHLLGESDRMIAQKIAAALLNGLRVILCLGETLRERRAGRTMAVVSRQLRIALKDIDKAAIQNVEIAYEPVWAIGTGQNASSEQISRVHSQIRKLLVKSFEAGKGNRVRILYGGSVKTENAAVLMSTPEVNGLLVGGASLNPDTFLQIVRSATK